LSNAHEREEKLIAAITPMVAPLGYEIVHLEVVNQREKTLRLFIDKLPQAGDDRADRGIGVEDCVKVTKAIDEPLDALPEVEAIFKGAYELEVSSPGVDRPLRQEKDYERFSGREARIHVFRPLTTEEIGNAGYLEKNPKQKNFVGTLHGVKNGKVLLTLSRDGASDGKKKKGKAKAAKPEAKQGDEVLIPLALISKANLEPDFEIADSGAGER
jgi:ribosome maturation factor RimP